MLETDLEARASDHSAATISLACLLASGDIAPLIARLGSDRAGLLLTAVWVPDDDGRAKATLGRTGAYVCKNREEFLEACHAVDLVVLSDRAALLDRQAVLGAIEMALDQVAVKGTGSFLRAGPDVLDVTPDREVAASVAAVLEREALHRRFLKRVIDVAAATLALVFMAPLMLAIGLAVRLDSPGPALFRQERLGQGRKPFVCLKFRTMRQDADRDSKPFWAQKNDPRITRLGVFLRRSRLDELPQFINVLRGDMSLVGPRPIRAYFAEQLAELVPFYDLRFVDKPGITGWAQVKYKYPENMAEQVRKFEYEFDYLKNRSFWMDVRIIFETVRIAALMKGT